nr:hypothetical protein [Tanacetum cinerariifolium]
MSRYAIVDIRCPTDESICYRYTSDVQQVHEKPWYQGKRSEAVNQRTKSVTTVKVLVERNFLLITFLVVKLYVEPCTLPLPFPKRKILDNEGMSKKDVLESVNNVKIKKPTAKALQKGPWSQKALEDAIARKYKNEEVKSAILNKSTTSTILEGLLPKREDP